MKLSILMPVFNEAPTLREAVKRVLEVEFPCDLELVVVDDGSTDGTGAICAELADDPRIIVRRHEHNRGKGTAIRTASQAACGDYAVICDADLEYDAADVARLLRPVIDGDAEVVYGTRTFTSQTAYSFWYVLGNKGVTFATNLLYDCWITDLMTCFKLMPLPLFLALDLQATGFGVEAEITAKLLRRGIRPHEVPISYRARSRDAGKKLTWRDGLRVLSILLRLRATAAPHSPPPAAG